MQWAWCTVLLIYLLALQVFRHGNNVPLWRRLSLPLHDVQTRSHWLQIEIQMHRVPVVVSFPLFVCVCVRGIKSKRSISKRKDQDLREDCFVSVLSYFLGQTRRKKNVGGGKVTVVSFLVFGQVTRSWWVRPRMAESRERRWEVFLAILKDCMWIFW